MADWLREIPEAWSFFYDRPKAFAETAVLIDFFCLRSNTRMGIRLSMQREKAVESITESVFQALHVAETIIFLGIIMLVRILVVDTVDFGGLQIMSAEISLARRRPRCPWRSTGFPFLRQK